MSFPEPVKISFPECLTQERVEATDMKAHVASLGLEKNQESK